MPLCVSCAAPAQHLHTVYKTRSNIRLGACTRCNAFLDPLIEHPPLLHLLDLVLLKPRVFLHLLYNRGTPPLHAHHQSSIHAGQAGSGSKGEWGKDQSSSSRSRIDSDAPRRALLRRDCIYLAVLSIAAEALIRLSRHSDQGLGPGTAEVPGDFNVHVDWKLVLVALLGAGVELLAQLGTSTALALGLLKARGWSGTRAGAGAGTGAATTSSEDQDPDSHSDPSRVAKSDSAPSDGRRVAFQPILIPLTLLYTSLLPLLLHLILGIWYRPPTSSHAHTHSQTHTHHLTPTIISLPPLPRILAETLSLLTHAWHTSEFDRIWIGTRLLGGMSAGFGLRVVLPLRPGEVTAVVLAGWAAAGVVGAVGADVWTCGR